MALPSLLRGQGVANLTVGETIASVLANAATNTAVSVPALEAGIAIGSGIDAAVHTFVVGDAPPGFNPHAGAGAP
jgi:hypothetical protein